MRDIFSLETEFSESISLQIYTQSMDMPYTNEQQQTVVVYAQKLPALRLKQRIMCQPGNDAFFLSSLCFQVYEIYA